MHPLERNSNNLTAIKRDITQLVLFAGYYLRDEIISDEISNARVTGWTHENAFKILTGLSERKKTLSMDDNIKMLCKETGCNSMNWIYFAQDRINWCLLRTLMNFGYNSHKRN